MLGRNKVNTFECHIFIFFNVLFFLYIWQQVTARRAKKLILMKISWTTTAGLISVNFIWHSTKFSSSFFNKSILFELAIVARTKLRRVRRNKVSGKKSKMLKMSVEMREEWRRNQRPNLIMELGDDCCTDHFNTVALSRTAAGGSNGGDRFLVMGVQRNGQLVPTLVLPWTKRSKVNTWWYYCHNLLLKFINCYFRLFAVLSRHSNNSTARILKPFSLPSLVRQLSRATAVG